MRAIAIALVLACSTATAWAQVEDDDDADEAAASATAVGTRTLQLGFAGLMDRGNRTDLPPINLTAGRLDTEGDYQLQSGGYYTLDIISDGTQEIAIEGPRLFRNIWINEIVINDLEVRPLGLDSIEFDDEGTVSMSFVAITPGQYEIRIAGTSGETQRAIFTIQ